MKKIVVLIGLCLIIALMLAACKGSDRKQEDAETFTGPASYIMRKEIDLQGGGESYFRSTQFLNGKLYCGIYSYEEGSSAERILSFSPDGEFLWERTVLLGENQDNVCWYVDGGDNIYVAAKESMTAENAEAQAGLSDRSEGGRLYKFDASGQLVYQQEIPTLTADTPGSVYASAIMADREGRLYLLFHDRVYLFGEDGSFDGSLSAKSDGVRNLVQGRSGEVYLLCQNSVGAVTFALADYEGKGLGKIYEGPARLAGDKAAAYSGTQFLCCQSDGLTFFDGESTQETALLRWMDENILFSQVRNFGLTEADDILILLDEGSGGNRSSRLTVWTPAAEGEQPESGQAAQSGSSVEIEIGEESGVPREDGRTVIRIATIFSGGFALENAVVDFNKTNEKYYVEMVSYQYPAPGVELTNDEARSRLERDITTKAKGYDLVLLDYFSPYNLARQGAFADLNPFLEESEVLQREDFFDTVLDAYTMDGKLLTLPRGVYMGVLAGRGKDFENMQGLTLRELLDYRKAHPEVSRLFCDYYQSDVASYLLRRGNDSIVFVEDGRVNFDEEECREVLEILKEHPDEDGDGGAIWRLPSGKYLMAGRSMNSFDSVQEITAAFGGSIAFLGYPDVDGKFRCAYSGHDMLAITDYSDCKEGAWEFMEYFLSREEYSWGLSSRISVFEEEAETQLYEQYYRDEDGNILLDAEGNPRSKVSHRVGYRKLDEGSEVIQYEFVPITEEDVQTVRTIMEAGGYATEFSPMGDVVYQVVREEGEAYFTGQKPLDTVVDIIRSRLTLYMQEQL